MRAYGRFVPRCGREEVIAIDSVTDTEPVRQRPAPRRSNIVRLSSRLVTPTALARVALVLGALMLADALLPHARVRLGPLLPLLPRPARATGTAVVLVSAIVLLRVAAGLRRRKLNAWRIAVVACVAVSLAALLRTERRPVDAAGALLLLIALVVTKRNFTARADPRSRWSALRLAAQGLIIGVASGLLSLTLGSHVASGTGLGARTLEVLSSMVGLGGGLQLHNDRFADVFHASLLVWGLLTILSTLIVLMRAAGPLATVDAADETRLRALLAKEGARDSLGYFALRDDKSVVWSPSGKAAVTYRVVGGVALISGDPLGDPEAWPGALTAYRELVDTYGWTMAAMGCSETGATVLCRELEITALALGDEAILDVATFSLDGRAMRGVRQACTRVARAGYEVSVRRVGELDAPEIAELRRSAASWRTDEIERGFSMALSRLGERADGACVVVTARREGRLCGVLHFVPWGTRGISLDLMRRDRASDNGLNEFMIATVMQECGVLGYDRVSLNFAVFRDALERGGQLGAGPIIRMWRRILLIASRWWQIESLYRFNEKFRPRWEPRFVCYPAARDIPRVALASLEAEAFVVRPRVIARLTGRG